MLVQTIHKCVFKAHLTNKYSCKLCLPILLFRDIFLSKIFHNWSLYKYLFFRKFQNEILKKLKSSSLLSQIIANVKPAVLEFRVLIKCVFNKYLIKLKMSEPYQIRFERKGVLQHVGRKLKNGHLLDVFICFRVKFDYECQQENENHKEEDGN